MVVDEYLTSEQRADEILAIRCILGERPALDEVICRWHDPVWRYLRRLSRSNEEATDYAQDTWVRVLQGIAKLRELSILRSWIFGIARRVAMDGLRERYAHAIDTTATLEEIAAPEVDIGLETDLAALEPLLETLPLRERETIVLFYLRELSIAQIAQLLEVPIGTIKSRLYRARNLLRNQHLGENA